MTSTIATAPSAAPPVLPRPALVLVADDNDDNRSLCVDYLSARGFRLASARTGREVVAMAIDLRPDAILMDILMPELDGLAAMRQIRAQPALASTPIIALTALAMAMDREQCLEAGATEYLSKPVSMRLIAKLLGELIGEAMRR